MQRNQHCLALSLAAMTLLAGTSAGQTIVTMPTDSSQQVQPDDSITHPADGEPPRQRPTVGNQLILTFPLLDLPYGSYATSVREGAIATGSERPSTYRPVRALSNPSMEQSTQLSLSTRYALFWASKRVFNRQPTDKGFRKVWKTGGELAVNTALDWFLPFGQSWQHEEFHRAVMTRWGISSNNTLNDWLTGRQNVNSGDVTSVNMVLDTNLSTLKATSNKDLVRLMAAGAEGQIYSGELMQQNQFFYQTGYLNAPSMLIRFISPQLYIRLCADRAQVNDLVATALVDEGSDPAMRDFTGPDFTAWAYDLYKPNEPYSARGPHPDGNGYDRYIYDDKLSQAQYNWIKKQSNLAWLNLASPINFFINRFTLKRCSNGETLEANFAFRYYPTSFGNQLGLNLMVKKGPYNLLVTPALNQNFARSFPSIEAMLIDYPVTPKVLLTTRLMVWTQPKDQAFMTDKAEVGGLASATANYRLNRFLLAYGTIGYKTNGWVAGNVFLDRRADVKLGLSVRL